MTLLRRGTYHFKQNDEGEWQIIGYTKEYDFKDEKKENCDVAQAVFDLGAISWVRHRHMETPWPLQPCGS